jgi:NAD(P)-dependent dehydrogenase (short-subunit alcohol dehydrogenase family)
VRGNTIAGHIVTHGGLASYLRCDITKEGAADALISEVVDRYDAVHSLVYCANAPPQVEATVVPADLAELGKKSHMDYFEAALAMRAALPYMMARRSGSIVNLISTSRFSTYLLDRAANCAAKAAVMNLTGTSARSFAAHGVRVNAIAPAGVATERVVEMLKTHPNPSSVVSRQALDLIVPQDVANAAVFLASDESRMIAGHVLALDAASSPTGLNWKEGCFD